MENIVGKQVNASYKHFLVFSRCFQRFFFLLLNLSQTSRSFYVSANKSFENTAGKGEIALNVQFLLFPQCFHRFGKLSTIFIKLRIVVCKLFQFGRV